MLASTLQTPRRTFDFNFPWMSWISMLTCRTFLVNFPRGPVTSINLDRMETVTPSGCQGSRSEERHASASQVSCSVRAIQMYQWNPSKIASRIASRAPPSMQEPSWQLKGGTHPAVRLRGISKLDDVQSVASWCWRLCLPDVSAESA